MTRKDYIILANALKDAYEGVENNYPASTHKHDRAVAICGVAAAADYIADALERDNPNFNKRLFLDTTLGRA